MVIQQKFFRSATHPSQVPYIVVLRDLLTDPPSWIHGFLPSRILVLQPQTVPPSGPDQKEVLQDSGTADLFLLDLPLL